MSLKIPVICLSLLFVYALPVWAQLPSNPPDEKSDTSEAQHRVGSGFLLVNKKGGTLSLSPYASVRYLNQKHIQDTYTDAFGRTTNLRKRDDIQFQKVTLYFRGWLVNPNFRYLLYVWSANTNQGQGAQVVVAGNMQYQINKHLDIGVGIGPLPATRSLLGQWPFWLRQDARPIADEFFRGSFTTGIWVQGIITPHLYYKTMLGNNLSQLGIDAGQLDNGFNTWSTSVWWASEGYGRLGPYGDFEKHKKLATVVGGSYTASRENRQSQPTSEDPENSQIRLSDGTGIFGLNAFAPNSQVQDARYQMTSFNGGVKYNGLSLDAECYLRWIDHFNVSGTIPVSNLFDNGFTVRASGMLIDKTLQLYSTGSYINGQYGKPSEITLGLNWFLFKNRIFRINPEVMFEDHPPVGYTSYPTLIGAKGTIFMVNLELFY